ncbi:MAG TPA: hypothetical protein VGG06_35245 [Thermoanaerobaculia bacterium]
MKFTLKLLAFVILLSTAALPAHAAPVLFGWGGEKIAKVMDLPDTPDFRMDSGEYIDVGYRYKQLTIFFIPVWNYDEHWCGYIGRDNRYLSLDRSDLADLVATAGLQLSDSPSKPFWDAVGGKLLIGFILLAYFGLQIRGRSPQRETMDGHEAPAGGEGVGA